MIQPRYGEITGVKLVCAESKIRVEGVFKDLEEVKKIISISATPFVTSKDAKGDVVTVKTRVVFTLVYLSEDGYKKAVCEADASADLQIQNATVNVFSSDV